MTLFKYIINNNPIGTIIMNYIINNKTLVIGKEIIGEEFNRIFKNNRFVKLTRYDENHHKFQFKDGLNIDTHEFQIKSLCSPGGIYFTEDNNEIHNWIYYNPLIGPMKYVRKVTIPDDAKIYVEETSFKTDKIILGTREVINEETYMRLIKQDINIFELLSDDMKTKQICMEFVKRNMTNILLIPKNILDKDICIESVKNNGRSLQYIPLEMRDKVVCTLAVTQDYIALKYVPLDLRDIDICTIAVSENFYVFKYVPNFIKNDVMMRYVLNADTNS